MWEEERVRKYKCTVNAKDIIYLCTHRSEGELLGCGSYSALRKVKNIQSNIFISALLMY